jgi:hypothetical protein
MIEPELAGIRGWLAVLALGMVLSPLRVLSDTVKSGYTPTRIGKHWQNFAVAPNSRTSKTE